MVNDGQSAPASVEARELRDGGEDAAGARIRLRRLQNPGRVMAFAAVVLVLLAASFVAGRMLTAPADVRGGDSGERVEPVLMVEERVVAAELSLPATVAAGAGYDIVRGAEHLVGADQSVVSAVWIQPGQTIGYGMVVAEVSGRPVITVPSSTPLFRDLVVGLEGADVRALQTMLVDLDYSGVAVDGVVDDGTIAAMQRLYAASGYELSPETQGRTISWREFARVPAADGTLLRSAAVGTVLDDETPVISAQTARPSLVAVATVLEADSLEIGQEVIVTADGGDPAPATVLGIGEYTVDATTGVGSKQVSVSLPTELEGIGAQTMTVRSRPQEKAGPAVPLVAVQSDEAGTFVRAYRSPTERAADADESAEDRRAAQAERRIAVEVSAQSGGWVAVAPDERLTVGMRLEVPE